MDTPLGLLMQKRLQEFGNLEGVFDCSHECWKRTTVRQKWKVIEELKQFLNCSFSQLVWLIAEEWCFQQEERRINRASHGLVKAVSEFAAHYREAEVFLMRCKHPAFVRFRNVMSERSTHRLEPLIKCLVLDHLEGGNATWSRNNLPLLLA